MKSSQPAKLSFTAVISAIRTAIHRNKAHDKANTSEATTENTDTAWQREPNVPAQKKRAPKVALLAKSKYTKLKASSAAGEVHKTRMALKDRGDKLDTADDRTAKMAHRANDFALASRQLMIKHRDRKWYQL